MFNKNRSVFNMYFIYFISMALFTGVRILLTLGVFDGLHDDISSIVFTCIIQGLIMFFIPLSLHAFFHRKDGGYKYSFSTVQLKPIKSKVILISLGLGVLAFFINIAVSTIFNGFIGFFGYEAPTGGVAQPSMFSPFVTFLIDVVLVAVLPALGEEFLHRGLLLNDISRVGYKKAIVISAFLFGLIHFNINQFFYAFVIGLLMGLVTVASKTLWPAIIIHFTNNFLSVYLSAARTNGWFLQNFYDGITAVLQSSSLVLTLLTTFLMMLLIVLFVVYLIFELFKSTTVHNVNRALESVFGNKMPQSLYAPSSVERHNILNEMLLTKSNLNLNIDNNTNPIDIVLPINRHAMKATVYDNVFLISSIILGGLITIFTFIWGVVW